MGFMLQNVVPWGRSFDEYVAMFRLSPADRQRRILGCGDGPAAFNSELTRRGGRVVSVDPIYQFGAAEIRSRINACFEVVLEQVRQNQSEFVWNQIPSPEALGRIRMAAMEQFLADLEPGLQAQRYQDAALPDLPFADNSFDLALCSHLLFLYSPQLDLNFHLQSILAMARVAPEVRIFPLVELGSVPSRHLRAVMAQLSDLGYHLAIEPTLYEFQQGGDEMLRIWRGEVGPLG